MDTTSTPHGGSATSRANGVPQAAASQPVALAVGVVGLGSLASLTVFFVVGGPFGTLNDGLNATLAILGALLAWTLRDRVSSWATALAIAGAAIAAIGSGLVISGSTGFFLAGLVSSVGFAGVGAWLIASALGGAGGRGSVRRLGLAAGLLMALGIATLPGIPMRLDDMATAPGWIWIGFVGWLGTFVAYPLWALAWARARAAS